MPLGEQRFRQVRSDEACAARNECPHDLSW
jgi:hypothetical protein